MLSRLSLAICAVLLLSSSALARSNPSEASQARSFPAPPIRARAGLVLDASTGAVLAAKNPDLHLPMASTTKIMTALVALRMGHLSDRIKVPKSAFDFESDATVMGLRPGQVVTLRELLYGLLLPSGADAANTIAIHYGGSESHFVTLMNRKAAQLGMRDTHYVNVHGLTAHNHYSSAYDLAILGQYVSTLPDLMKIVSTRTYQWNGHLLTNLNRVLFWYPGVDGIKPGYTDDAGICQVLDAQRGGRHVVVVLLNTPDPDIDARNLLNFGLRDFSWVQSRLPGDGPSLVLNGADRLGSYVYFPGSGHYVRGKLWTGYLANGGFLALGFPRTEPLHEAHGELQYFQNGALSMNPSTGRVSRLALGLTPLPTRTVTPTPTPSRPTATPTPTRTPSEGTVGLPKAAPKGTPQPVATKTPPLPPGIGPTPTPTPAEKPSTAQVFVAFQRAHWSWLGNPVSKLSVQHGYPMQIFTYGALVYDPKKKATYLLSLGDRLLGARHYLPTHPGNVYPGSFAPVSILKAIGWAPYGAQSAGVSR